MANNVALELSKSIDTWTAFLSTAARMYKYGFYDQLMIFAQRPEATACAEYDFWNKRMHRYVRRGSRGIAILKPTDQGNRLGYLFDVADTGALENSRPVYLWKYQKEHTGPLSSALLSRFEVPLQENL